MGEKRYLFLLVIFLFSFLMAAHQVSLLETSSVDEDVTHLYNLSVNNTDGLNNNITQVNITFDSNFSFLASSQGSDAGGDVLFVNGSTVLSWSNYSNHLILNQTNNFYFWFNATVSYPGSYNLTIQTVNSTSVVENLISIEVNDTSAPDVSFINLASFGNYSDILVLNVSVSDFSSVDSVIFNLTNSTGLSNLSFIASNIGNSWNASLNTSQFSEGIYNISVLANDSNGFLNESERVFNLTFDNTAPTGSYSCDDASPNVGDTINCTCSPIDSLSGINSAQTSYTESPSTSSIGSFTITCTFEDNAGNSGNASTSYTVSSSTGGSSGGSSSSKNFWSSTFVLDEGDLDDGYNIELSRKQRMKVMVDSEIHYIGVVEISDGEATINITSEPIQIKLLEGEAKKVDATGDDFYDLLIKLNRIEGNDANLTVTEINEAVPEASESSSGSLESGATGVEESHDNSFLDEEGSSSKFGLILVIILFVLAISYYLFKSRNFKISSF